MNKDRNPDIRHDSDVEPYDVPPEKIPEGCYFQPGRQLMLFARKAKIPYGIVERRMPCGPRSFRIGTAGLILRLEDRQRFEHARATKRINKVYQPAP